MSNATYMVDKVTKIPQFLCGEPTDLDDKVYMAWIAMANAPDGRFEALRGVAHDDFQAMWDTLKEQVQNGQL